MGATLYDAVEDGIADEGDEGRQGDRKFVVALARGLKVLRSFRVRDGFLSNHEISQRTGLPKATVTRLTYTLCELGYLSLNPRLGRYQLAPGAITLGYAALANLGIRHVAKEYMDELADRVAAPVALGVLDQHRALYIEISRGPASFTMQLDIGSRIPLATTAMGRAILAVLPDQKREPVLNEIESRFSDRWPDIRRDAQRARAEYQQNGFVLSAGEWRQDVFGAAAALNAADGSGIYAFNCGGPPHAFTQERLSSEIGPAVGALARIVAGALSGARTPKPHSDWIASAVESRRLNKTEEE